MLQLMLKMWRVSSREHAAPEKGGEVQDADEGGDGREGALSHAEVTCFHSLKGEIW